MLNVMRTALRGGGGGGGVGGHALNSHGNYVVDINNHGKKSWNCVLKICGNPELKRCYLED